MLEKVCRPVFEKYIGTADDSYLLDFDFLAPPAAKWNAGDHTIICVAHDGLGERLSEPLLPPPDARSAPSAAVSNGSPPESILVCWQDLQPGMCVEDLAATAGVDAVLHAADERAEPKVVDCRFAHDGEVIGNSTMTEPVAGLAASARTALENANPMTAVEERCVEKFEDYVGTNYAPILRPWTLDVTSLIANPRAWKAGAHTLICVAKASSG